ncbi:GntR family transcriptional regulator [Ramlibacter sp. MAHUQ-53]|uniref:GntR family transcriptional regulator n=1 Tax=unclassified Ramlibacter TaxID=2617605 RepID=UPI003637D604
MGSTRTESAERPAARAEGGDVAARTQRMYDQIVSGLTEHRIAPGTRLREEKLAGLFDVSRTQVRKVLLRLEHEGLVERQPHRGVTVVAPDMDETREIFEARRLIEPWVVARLCSHCTKKGALGLRRIVREEQKAHEAGDRRTAVRLSGEFHRALAQAAGNRAIAKSMDELTLRTCLAILANQAPTPATCRDDEHDRIIEAIEQGDAKLAARLMVSHLEHIESSLEAPMESAAGDSLDALFAELSTPAPRKRPARKQP